MSYNGWSNYATWRVNLELFDGQSARDLGISNLDQYEAGKVLKDWAEEIIYSTTSEGVARVYALAFLADVDWHDIAGHYLDEAEEVEA
jgi:hypothetical protein